MSRRPPTTITKDSVPEYLKELARRLDKDTLSGREVDNDGRISSNTINKYFGGFSEALIQAGLKPNFTRKRNRDRMLDDLETLIEELHRAPSKKEINEHLVYRAAEYKTTFGDLEKAITLAKERRSHSLSPKQRSIQYIPPAHPAHARRRYGAAIDFRGLRHAPINENGVIFLFGMLAEELGFVVESVQNGFPDCDAKRKLPDGTFEGVRIEFEFRSTSFLQHGHDPQLCDILVCWEHDWTDCPLEAIDLSKVIEQLEK
jgi:hypothetical protein